jgi:hypothetical protein
MNYRTQAIVPLNTSASADVFRYYVDTSVGYQHSCSVCKKDFRTFYDGVDQGAKCFRTKRVTVSGFWFWRKKCPLKGTHIHFKCRHCNAVSIAFLKDPPKMKVKNGSLLKLQMLLIGLFLHLMRNMGS